MGKGKGEEEKHTGGFPSTSLSLIGEGESEGGKRGKRER